MLLFSSVVQLEKTGNGIIKRLALPQFVPRMAVAKCLIVFLFSVIEIILFFVFFALMGIIVSSRAGMIQLQGESLASFETSAGLIFVMSLIITVLAIIIAG